MTCSPSCSACPCSQGGPRSVPLTTHSPTDLAYKTKRQGRAPWHLFRCDVPCGVLLRVTSTDFPASSQTHRSLSFLLNLPLQPILLIHTRLFSWGLKKRTWDIRAEKEATKTWTCMWREGEGRELAGPTAAPSAGGVSELGPQPCGDPTPVGTPPSEAVEV